MKNSMHIGIAGDHAGFEMKSNLGERLREAGHTVTDFGADALTPDDDYPDYVIPLARAVASGKLARGIAICGSGIGACVAANKIKGIRAGLCDNDYSARQGVEDDDMNVLCLGGRVIDEEQAWELVQVFLDARFSELDRHRRRLRKIRSVEEEMPEGPAEE